MAYKPGTPEAAGVPFERTPPHAADVRTARHRREVAPPLGRRPALPRPRRRRASQVVRADDVPLPVGRPAHRALVQLRPPRRLHPLHADAGTQRYVAHGLRRLRAARRERGDQARRAPPPVDDGEHRADARPAPHHGHHVRLGPRDRLLPAGVLPLEPVVLPQVLREGAGLPRLRPRELVPRLPDGARQRAGQGGALRALRRRGRAAQPRTVVPPHHRLRRGAPRLRRARRLAREDQDDAAQLDRAQRGGAAHLRSLPSRYRHEGDRGLHHPPRYRVRRHLHGPGARAPRLSSN